MSSRSKGLYKTYGDIAHESESGKEKYEEQNNPQPPQKRKPVFVIEIPNSDAYNNLFNSTKNNMITVVDVYGPWCAPCINFSSRYEELAKEYSTENIRFCKANIDEMKEVDIMKNVYNVPTFLFYIGNNMRTKVVGVDQNAILKTLNEMVSYTLKR